MRAALHRAPRAPKLESFPWRSYVHLPRRHGNNVLGLGGSVRLQPLGRRFSLLDKTSLSSKDASLTIEDEKQSSNASTQWTETAVRLEKVPLGSMTAMEWNEAEHASDYWASLRTSEGVSWAWRILDRVVEERRQRIHQTNETSSDYDPYVDYIIESTLPTEWLNRVVDSSCPDNVMDLQQILAKIDQYSPHLLPNTRTYNVLINTFAKQDPKEAPRLGETILQKLWKDSEVNHSLRPDAVTYSNVLYLWAQSGHPEAAIHAEALLKQMQSYHDIGWEDLAPTNRCYLAIIVAYAKIGDGRRAEQWLQRRQQTPSLSTAYYDRMTFSQVINAWVNSKEPGAAERAEAILNHMEHLYDKQGIVNVKPNEYCYAAVVAAYGKSRQPVKAEAVWQRLQDRYHATKDPDICPTVAGTTTLINAWGKSRDPRAARRAEALLQQLFTLAEVLDNRDLLPNQASFNAVLNAWAKSPETWHAAERAEALLHKMEKLYEGGWESLKPGVVTFNTVMNCIAKSTRPGAAERAEAVLQRMKQLYNGGNEGVKPDNISYSTVMDAWSRSGLPEAPMRADAILKEMQQLHIAGDASLRPTRYSYHAILRTWARTGKCDAPIQVEELINEMRSLAEAGQTDLQPDANTYNALITAWVNAGHIDIAEKVLARMEKEGNKGDVDLRPDRKSFHLVMSAWASSGDPTAPQRCESILNQMLELHQAGNSQIKPHSNAYNSVIIAWSKSRDPEAGRRAQEYLEHMKALGAAGHDHCKPLIVSYSATIQAWLKQKDSVGILNAYKLLDEMNALEEKSGNISRQDMTAYRYLLMAIGDSALDDKAERAHQILNEMIAKSFKLDIHEWNLLLGACQSPSGGYCAFQIAVEVLEKIHNNGEVSPNAETYMKFFSACANAQGEEECMQVVLAAYRECCERGFGRAPKVIKVLKRVAPRVLHSSEQIQQR